MILAALAEFAPDECAQFEAEFQQAIAQVSKKFDLAPLDAVYASFPAGHRPAIGVAGA